MLEKYGNNVALSTFVCVSKYFGEIGNGLFIFITGYFLLNFKFSFAKIFKLIVEISVYSATIFFILFFVGRYEFSILDFLYAFFPIISNAYWFVTAYIVFYFFAPSLKRMMNCCSKNQVLSYLFILAVFCLMMQLYQVDFVGVRIIGFIELALIGAFIKKYPPKHSNSLKFNAVASCAWFVGLVCAVTLTQILFLKQNASYSGYFFCRFYSLAVWPLCLFMFLTFKNLKIKENKTINYISSSTFCIYLIHENFLYRTYVIPEIYDGVYNGTMWCFVLFSIAFTLTEFFVSLAIDKLFQISIFKSLKRINKTPWFERIDKRMNKI